MESYPPTQVTNYGIDLLFEGVEPLITYVSPDNDIAFYLNGGLAPWPGVTEGAVLEDGIEGLHPTFSHLDHKGARQDGATWADTVYDPAEMTMEIILTAQTPENLRKVIRKWIGAWDPQRQGTLSWVTPDSGEWWCHPRLFRAPQDKMARTMARSREQKFTWAIRNDDAFWRTHDSVSMFGFQYNDAFDDFNRDDAGTLGANWFQTYSGPGSGVCETEDNFWGNDSFGRARWVEAGNLERGVVNRWLGKNEVQTVVVQGTPTTWNLTFNSQTTAAITHPASAGTVQTALENLSNIAVGDVSVTGGSGTYTVTFLNGLGKQDLQTMSGLILSGGTDPVVTVAQTTKGSRAVTATDNQVISLKLADQFSFPWGDTSYVDIWGRMDSLGTTGVRVRIGLGTVTLSRFNAGVETVLHEKRIFGPTWHETWTVILGTATSPRHFRVLRGARKNGGGHPVIDFKETGTGSALGSNYRGGGFGMEAGDAFGANSGQITPASVNEWSMGDNLDITQAGYLTVTNVGDQDRFPDFVVYGPGLFKFGDGPGTEPTIEFGPLTDGQVALIKTHPGQRSVTDITTDVSEQDLTVFQGFIQRLISLAVNNNIPPLLSWFQSAFGIEPSQGNLYSLLKGRFTKPVPARPVAGLAVESKIAVSVENGNAFTKVIAALTPVRRWPE